MQLEVIAKTNFNFFNGERIAKWRAVLLPLNSISLRDLEAWWD